MSDSKLQPPKVFGLYLIATGDTLIADACRALGLPHGKHDLRRRLAALDSPGSVRSGNHSANGPIGSSLSAAAALKWVIEGLPAGDFTTNNLRERAELSAGTASKALRKLSKDISGTFSTVAARAIKFARLDGKRPFAG